MNLYVLLVFYGSTIMCPSVYSIKNAIIIAIDQLAHISATYKYFTYICDIYWCTQIKMEFIYILFTC